MKRWLLPVLLILGFAARMGYGLRFPPQPSGSPILDFDGYVALGSSFADSWTYSMDGHPSAHREPGYPLLLGFIFKVLGKGYAVLLLTHALLGIGALYLLFLAGRKLFGEDVALTAVAIGAFYPPFIFYSAWAYRETMLVFIGLASVYALMTAFERGRTVGFAAAGAVSALGALTSTIFLPFGLAAPLPMFLSLDALSRQVGAGWVVANRRRWTTAYLAVFVFLCSLWPIRNYHVLKTWIIGCTATGGSTFYTYLVIPQEIAGTPAQEELFRADPVFSGAKDMAPADREKYLWKAGVDWVKAHPWKYARLVAWRLFWDEWRLWPRPRTYAHSYAAIKWISILSDGWIIPLGFAGVIIAGTGVVEGVWIYLFVFMLSLVYAAMLSTIRYRLPSMPWFILFASFSLHHIYGICRGRENKRPDQ